MRRMTRRQVLAGAMAPVLASCGRSTGRRSRDKSTITVLYRGLDEWALGPDDDTAAKFLVFCPLAAWNRRGELEGRLAESWEHSPDFRTWTIRLRSGVRWHDGAPVTAHDVKFTLDLLQYPATNQLAPGSYDVRVIDDRTYTITTNRQQFLYGYGPIDNWNAYWPKHLLEGLDPTQINTWISGRARSVAAPTGTCEPCPKR